jgi:hypothetical protein
MRCEFSGLVGLRRRSRHLDLYTFQSKRLPIGPIYWKSEETAAVSSRDLRQLSSLCAVWEREEKVRARRKLKLELRTWAKRFGGAVSRILSFGRLLAGERIIYLLRPYPKLCPPKRTRNGPSLEFPIWPCTGRGLPCPRDRSRGGGLLPHLFTLTRFLRSGRSVFCGAIRRRALKRASRVYCRLNRITRRPALWCSDFPPPVLRPGAILRPTEAG